MASTGHRILREGAREALSPSVEKTPVSAPPLNLSPLCATCLYLLSPVGMSFAERLVDRELPQTLPQLESSALRGNCHFCYVRWEDLCQVTTERERSSIISLEFPEFDFGSAELGEEDAFDVDLKYEHDGDFITQSSFRFYRATENFFSASRDLTNNNPDTIDWQLAQNWLMTCTQDHISCNQSQGEENSLPTRLIHLGSGFILQPKLTDTCHLPKSTKYMTLSHCWGKIDILKLTLASIEELKREIVISQLPKSFSDAMQVAQRLGIQYIWIDSLCIIQDSPEDWRRESATMGNIYRYSWCNIAASSASDGSYGLLSTELLNRNTFSIQPLIVQLGTKNVVFYCNNENLWRNSIDRSPLRQRAWVVQEAVLSPRSLYFGKHQLFWDCTEFQACELYAAGKKDLRDITSSLGAGSLRSGPKTSEADLLCTWLGMVSQYSQCKLTMPKDKLVAISGLAKSLGIDSAKYLAGLWRISLPSQLLWQTEKTDKDRNPAGNDDLTGVYDPRAPSWSWASSSRKVFYYELYRGEDPLSGDEMIKVIEAQVSLSGEDPTGEVRNGHIRLQGSIVKGTEQEFRSLEVYPDLDDSTSIPSSVRAIYFLPVVQLIPGVIAGLVIEPTRKVKGQFYRRGTCRFYLSRTAKMNLQMFNDLCEDGINRLAESEYESVDYDSQLGRYIFSIMLV